MYLQKTFGRQKLDCHFDEEVFNFTLFMDDIVGREKIRFSLGFKLNEKFLSIALSKGFDSNDGILPSFIFEEKKTKIMKR